MGNRKSGLLSSRSLAAFGAGSVVLSGSSKLSLSLSELLSERKETCSAKDVIDGRGLRLGLGLGLEGSRLSSTGGFDFEEKKVHISLI